VNAQDGTARAAAGGRAHDVRTPRQRTEEWFAQRGWKTFPFQKAVWRAALQGKSGLLHATTGSGKTYAVWMAALQRAMREKKKKARAVRVMDHVDARARHRQHARNAGTATRTDAGMERGHAHR
jgi:ATP-dependent Lhr-like helicase